MKSQNSGKNYFWLVGIGLALVLIIVMFLIFSPKAEPQILPTLVVINTSEASLEASPAATETSSLQASPAPTNTVEANLVTAQVQASPVATNIPPTDVIITPDAQELSLQEQVQLDLLNLEPVDTIITLDVDLPEGQPPLVYLEVVLQTGYNNIQTIDMIKQQLDSRLNTSQYSDFLLIASDGLRAVEYTLNVGTNTWIENQLLDVTPATPQNP